MEVSTFELLYKPLTPTGGDLARRVLQGYFLTVTNLEAQSLLYRIEFRISLPDDNAPERRLDPPKAVFISDVAGPDNVFTTPTRVSPTSDTYFNLFRIPAGKTALISLLPDLRPTPPTNFSFETTPANYEVRGYASLALPAVFSILPSGGIVYGAQIDQPARVLLSPESRGTFLPQGWPATVTTDLDFDQTLNTIPLANGQSLNTVESDPLPVIVPIASSENERNALRSQVEGMIDGQPGQGTTTEQIAQLASLLTRLGGDEARMQTISSMLLDLGVPVKLQPSNEHELVSA